MESLDLLYLISKKNVWIIYWIYWNYFLKEECLTVKICSECSLNAQTKRTSVWKFLNWSFSCVSSARTLICLALTYTVSKSIWESIWTSLTTLAIYYMMLAIQLLQNACFRLLEKQWNSSLFVMKRLKA